MLLIAAARLTLLAEAFEPVLDHARSLGADVSLGPPPTATARLEIGPHGHP